MSIAKGIVGCYQECLWMYTLNSLGNTWLFQHTPSHFNATFYEGNILLRQLQHDEGVSKEVGGSITVGDRVGTEGPIRGPKLFIDIPYQSIAMTIR